MEAITEYLEKHKLSQAEFGQKLGVGQAMVGSWLAKRRGISLEKALEIEMIFGIDAHLLNDKISEIEIKFADRRKRKRKALSKVG